MSPGSPHFSGLHEAAIKSVKHHLRRMLGSSRLNLEDVQTLIYQVEAILNSRPICPLSSDPSDLRPLTPGHFLIVQPLIRLPESEDIVKIQPLKLYEHQQQLVRHIWTRWHKEYLHLLQERSKWCKKTEAWKVGTLVLLKGDNLPTQLWKTARIMEVHPGKDGVVRVATVRTATGLKRAVHILCPLDIDLE